MFTKQYYEAIAEIIKGHIDFDDCLSTGAFVAKSISRELANYFAKGNPNFNSDKFLKACGVK